MPTEITYRLTWKQRLLTLSPLLLIFVVETITFRSLFPLFGIVGGCVGVALNFRYGARISAAGIELWNPFQHERIPWQYIAFIELRSTMGTKYLRLHFVNGKKRRVRAPMTGFMCWDSQFDQKAATIRHWWMWYTGQLAVPAEYRAP